MLGQPIANNKAQFQWEQLQTSRQECVPEMYTLTHTAHIRKTSSNLDYDTANSSDELLDDRANKSNYYEDEHHHYLPVTRSAVQNSSLLLSPPTSAQSCVDSDSDSEDARRRINFSREEAAKKHHRPIMRSAKKRQSRITGEFLIFANSYLIFLSKRRKCHQ
jgi:hypothetical protein